MKTILGLCINLVVLIIADASNVKLIAGDRNVVKKDGATHTISKYYVVPNDFIINNVTNSNSTEESQKKTVRVNHKNYSKNKASEFKEENNKTNENNDEVRRYSVAGNHTSDNNIVVNETVVSLRSDQNKVQTGEDTAETTKSESVERNSEADNKEPEGRKPSSNIVQENQDSRTETDKDVNDLATTTESRVTDNQRVTTETRVIKPWVVQDTSSESTVIKWVVDDKSPESLVPTVKPLRTTGLPWRIENKNTEHLPWHIENKNTEKLPWNIENKNTENLQWHIENKNTEHLPWHIENKNTEHLPWHIKNKNTENLPWHIENKNSEYLPWNNEDNTTYNLPWHIEDKNVKHGRWHIEDKIINHQPWTVKQRTILPWIIEDRTVIKVPGNGINNDFGHSPKSLYHSGRPSITTHNDKVLIDSNRASTVHWVKNSVKKPYHIYTYVIKPDTRLYKISNSGKIVDASRQSNSNLLKKSYSQSTSQNGHKYVKSSHNLSKPTVDISSQLGKSQLKHTKYVTPTYISGNAVTSDRLSGTPQDEYLVGPEIETNRKPDRVPTSEPETNSNDDNDIPSVSQEVSSQAVLLSNAPNPNRSVLKSSTNGENADFVNTVHTDINVNLIKHTDVSPSMKPKVLSHTEYTLPNDSGEVVYGAHQPDYSTKTSAHSEFTISDDYNNPAAVNSEDRNQHTGFIPIKPYHPEYTNVFDDYHKPSNVYSQNIPQHSGFMTTAQSEFTNIPNDYSDRTTDNNEGLDQRPGFVPVIPNYPEYTNIVDDYDEPTGENPSQHSGYTTKTSAYSDFTTPKGYNNPTAANSEQIDQHEHPGFIPTGPYQPKPINVFDDYDKPSNVYSQNTPQHSSVTTSADSEFTNMPNDYSNPTTYKNEDIDQRPNFVPAIPKYPEYTKIVNDYDEPTAENPSQPSGYTIKTSAHSEFNIPNDYNSPTAVASEGVDRNAGFIPMVPYHPGKTNIVNNYEDLNPVIDGLVPYHPEDLNVHDNDEKPITMYYDENTQQHPGYDAKPGHEHDIYTYPGLVQNVLNTPEYVNVQHNYDKPIPDYGEETAQHPGWKVSSHSKYTNLPNHYSSYDENIDMLPENTDILNDDIVQPTLVDDGPTENNNNPLSYQHYEHTVHTAQPSLVPYLPGKQPTELNYPQHINLKMAPTYKLLTLDNLLKLHDAVTKAIGRSKPDASNYIAMINLRKIIDIILILAETLKEPDDSDEWYMKIFYNAEKNRHPLQLYVYNLIRQRWLHELMSVLWKKNFDIHILQNPRMFSFLRSWEFPNYVQSFMEAKDFNNDFDLTHNSHIPGEFSTQTYDDLLEEVPEDLENYVANKVIQSYKAPNDGIVVSIAGVDVEPDARAIVNILHNYLHFKNVQQNVLMHDNKLDMLKQIVLFLSQKGYGPRIISELINKLYSTVDLTEGKECRPYHPNFAKKMYKVVVPVLRRSGR